MSFLSIKLILPMRRIFISLILLFVKVVIIIVDNCYKSWNPRDKGHNDQQERVHKSIHVGDTHKDS
jgi:hypothetical protein